MTDWVRLELGVTGFDDAAFAPNLLRARESGIVFTTMAELGDTPAHRRRLDELTKVCSADVPDRREFSSYDEYVAQRIEAPGSVPEGIVVAIDDGRWAGRSATSLPGGVLHRDDGCPRPVPRAGAVAGAETAGHQVRPRVRESASPRVRESGHRWLRTFHHPRHAVAIGTNRRLGYVDRS